MSARTILTQDFVIGGISFFVGFIGPILGNQVRNQGPLLGIFTTGPVGYILGILIRFLVPAIKMKRRQFKDPLRRVLDRL